jgi:hypothetical protein
MGADEMNELQKIDVLRERGNIGYAEAREILAEVDGDLLEALVRLESRGSTRKEQIFAKGGEIVDKVKDLIRQGNVTKIRVKTKDDVILDIPVTAGVIGAMFAPYLALLGAVAALATQCSIEIERAKPKVEEETPVGAGERTY